MLVIHGMVRSCRHFADGRRFIGGFYTSGDLFGMERNPTHGTAAEAVCETAIIFYPAPDWHAPAQNNFSTRMVSAIMQGTEQARGHAQWLGRLTALEKISAFLLEIAARSKTPHLLTLEMPRQDIADYLGLTVETVSRGLAQLRRDGLIAFVTPRQLKILNLTALRAMND
jgi:CRP/FNR family nitrogen fixation transcriptional regulator